MKKSLLVVAVAAALPTFAQAQSSVTLYGILDAGLEYSNANANALGDDPTATPLGDTQATLRVKSGVLSGSRVGIRGSEDLGGGLRGIFTVEHRLNVDTGDSTNTAFWSGQAFVGVASSWGQLTLGRQYTPLYNALAPADFSGNAGYNNWSGFTGNMMGTVTPQGPIRLNNSIAYKSPTFGGLTAFLTYAPGENPVNGETSNDIYGIAAGWQLGGLYLTGGYHEVDTDTDGAFESIAAVAASYKFTNVGLSLGYTQQEFVGGSDTNIVLASAFVNVGPGTLIANVAYVDPSIAGRINDTGVQAGLTYSLPLSKRTNWYLAYGYNDISGLQPVGSTTLVDNAMRGAVGVRHFF